MRPSVITAAAALAITPLAGCGTMGAPWERDYRPSAYEPYALGHNDVVYRGQDGRYYCRRPDGTVGLVVGAGVGGLLGHLIAPRGSRTLGTIIGAAGGAAVGYAIERQEIRCH